MVWPNRPRRDGGAASHLNGDGAMSFLKKLFGGGGGAKAAAATEAVEHDGYLIYPEPVAEGGEHRIAGRIEREIGGERKVHAFQRADRFASRDTAVEMTVSKARQIIREQGERLFH